MSELLEWLHHIITFFVLTAWLYPSCRVWRFHVFFCIILLIHWGTNNNECFISQINNQKRGDYTIEAFSQFGINIDRSSLHLLNCALVIIPGAISLYRIRMSCHK